MKKKLLALLLALVMLLGLLPAAAPKAEAADLLGLMDIGGKFYNGINKTVSDIKAGKTGNDFLSAFTGTMKNLGCQFAGINTSSGSSSGSYQQTVIVNEVNLTNIESSLADISYQLNLNKATMNAIKSQIVSAQNSLSSDISDLKSAVLTAIGNSTTAGYYDNYLNTYFTWYNKFLNSVEYCERSLNTNLNTGSPRKNDYDYYYLLQGQTANCYLPAALQMQANYLNGDNQSALGNMSIVDMLYNYYSFAGRTQEETAALVKEYVKLMYYSYTLACYDYMMLSVYMLGWCKENNQSVYIISSDYDRSTAQLKDDLETVLSDYLKTSQTLFEDLYERFAEVSDISVYAITPSGYATTYESDGTALTAAKGATLYLPNAGDVFSKTMGSDLQEVFGELADFTYSVSGASTSLSGRELKLNGAGTVTVTIKMTLGSKTKEVAKYTVTVTDGYLGKGTREDPVIITSAAEWNAFAAEYNSSSNWKFDGAACLAADIDFNGSTITPFQRKFRGTFYGNGHTVKNGKIVNTVNYSGLDYYSGLFPYLENAKIYDLKLESILLNLGGERSDISPFHKTASLYAGVLAGQVRTSEISRCSVTNCMLKGEGSSVYTGGIAGWGQKFKCKDCVVIGSDIANAIRSKGRTGGILGYSDPDEGYTSTQTTLTNCGVANCKLYTLGNEDETLSTTSYIGGLIGEINGNNTNYVAGCWLYMLSGKSEIPATTSGITKIYSGLFAGYFNCTHRAYIYYNTYVFNGTNANTDITKLNATGYCNGSYTGDCSFDVNYKSNTAAQISGLPLGSYAECASDTFRLKTYTIEQTGSPKLAYLLNEGYEPDGICVNLLCGGKKVTENIKGYKFTTSFNGKAAGKYETTLTCGNTVTLNPVVYAIVNVLGGDVDGNGKVELKDVSALFQWWNGKKTLPADAISLGDYNGDKTTDIRDAAAIFRATA